MEATKILNYISYEAADHSKGKLTQVLFNNKTALMGRLLKEDQNIPQPLQTNLWAFRALDGSMLTLKGADIKTLKVG